MTYMRIESTLFGRWKVIWDSGGRTFIHGHAIVAEKKFKTLPEIFEWAKSNYHNLDPYRGSGIGLGVTLCMEDLLLAEYYSPHYGEGEVIKEHFKTLRY